MLEIVCTPSKVPCPVAAISCPVVLRSRACNSLVHSAGPLLRTVYQPTRSLHIVSAAAPGADVADVVEDVPVDADLEAKAILRFVRGSPNKIRRVLDQIRGCTYEEALIILEYMPHRACEPILKLLVSAASNAKHNLGMKKSKLYVSECFADGGPVMKRLKFRAKGRGWSHIARIEFASMPAYCVFSAQIHSRPMGHSAIRTGLVAHQRSADQIRKPTSHITIKVRERA